VNLRKDHYGRRFAVARACLEGRLRDAILHLIFHFTHLALFVREIRTTTGSKTVAKATVARRRRHLISRDDRFCASSFEGRHDRVPVRTPENRRPFADLPPTAESGDTRSTRFFP